MSQPKVLSALLALLCAAALAPAAAAAFTPLTPPARAAKATPTDLVGREDEAILAGDGRRLRAVFLPGKSSHAALGEALERRAFLTAWSAARGIELASVAVSLRTPHIAFPARDRVRIFAVVSEAYTYRYLPGGGEGAFGLGVRHEYVLAREGGRWYIRSDYFTDPLDQDTRIPSSAQPAAGATLPTANPSAAPPRPTNAAVQYADRYCGAAPGCGNGGLYNSRYNNYNGEGGDCTNFISQALQAGGFRESGTWRYDRRLGEGSRAWSNAEGLRDYLDRSGRAELFASGPYAAVTRQAARFPLGAAQALREGDLITYVEGGTAVHTGMVVAHDARGVPLVDTHTSDRYHVPWDLGWDRTTRYLLWHVAYPLPREAIRAN